jgi:ABC-type transporter Mla subunit MlaD
MDTLLMVAVVLITLATIVQAGVLLGMYLMSRRLTDKVNDLITDSRTLIGPFETVTINLKTASDELAEVGKIARDQAHRIEDVLNETRETIRCEVEDLRERVVDTVEEARQTILTPLRKWSAIASGIGEGVRTLFRKTPPAAQTVDQESPAA